MRTLLPALAALLLISGCAEREPAAGSPEAGSFTVTHYADATELFVEYRPLVVDRRRRFDAHLSWLSDYRAVSEGRLIAELVWPDGRIDQASAAVSDTPGIFRPLLTATRSGEARLRLRLEAKGRQSVHDLGIVRVYPTSDAGAAAAPHPAPNPNRIAFPKEAQWRVPFRAEAAARGPFAETLPVTVDVRLAPDAEAVVSSPVAGVVRVNGAVPAPGMRVRAGQTLATVAAQLGGGEDVASLDLAISEARIALDAARRETSRMDRLVRAEAAPQRRLDEARTSERLAAAQLQAAQRRRAALGGGGSGVPLVSPISGQVLTSSIVRGGSVAPGAELMRIGDPTSLWLVAQVPEAQAPRVGQPQGLDVVVGGETLPLASRGALRLVQAPSYIDPRTRTAQAVFAFSGTALKPGQRLPGRLHAGGATEALSVPASAVLNEGGQDVVYVQATGEAFERRLVQVGARSGDRVAIRGDVRPGERVVTEGVATVRAAAATPDAFGHGHAH